MMNWLVYYAREANKKELDREERLLVLNFFEKKRKAHEDQYLNVYKEHPEHRLSMNILKAVCGGMDAHTMYFSDEEASSVRALLLKEISGVGIGLKEGFRGIIVSHLLPNGPAERSGLIRAGDHLIEINDQDTAQMDFRGVLNALEGPEFSTVKLGMMREGEGKFQIALSREKIVLETERIQVDFEPYLDGVIGKIRVDSFYDNRQGVSIERDLREAIKELRSQGNVYGLILDFRRNSGGFLNQAVKVAGLFIHKGVVVISKYANDEIRYTRSFDPKTYFDGPLVILTSKASASAAEIVAQSLKDEGCAILMGDPATYGKGSMQYQTITDPAAKNFFKVTVGRYFTISGRSPQMTGVPSDIVVATDFAPYAIGEKYLTFPLSTETIHDRNNIKEELKRMFQNYEMRAYSKWERMIPQLKRNSIQRLSKDQNYQSMLQYQELLTKQQKPTKRERDFGCEDIQMQEATSAIKDMIQIDIES